MYSIGSEGSWRDAALGCVYLLYHSVSACCQSVIRITDNNACRTRSPMDRIVVCHCTLITLVDDHSINQWIVCPDSTQTQV